MTISSTCIVIPCFNEALRIDARLFSDFVSKNSQVRLLFVNDGSTDGTGVLLDGLGDTSPRISVLHLPRNQGKAEAIRQGMIQAMASHFTFVAFLDADLATPFAEVLVMTECLVRYSHLQLVMGSRVMLLGRDIARHPWRHYLGRIFATCVSVSLNSPVYDTQCGAKVFRVNSQLESALKTPFSSRWIFDVEILARMARDHRVRGSELGKIVMEHPVMSWRDVSGSKVRSGDFLRAIYELYGIYSKYNRYLA